MKKILSIIIAVIMTASVLTANAIPCFAVWYGSIEEAEKDIVIKVTVNGIDSIYGEYEHLDDDDKENGYFAIIDFIYSGDKVVIRWELKDLVEGKDYIILEETETTIRVAIINGDVDNVWANAITDDESTTGIKNPNKDHTSPDTGAALMSASILSMGAGISLLAVARKRK